jgi:DNA repair protein RadD
MFLDHSDNHARLGFVTDIHHDALDDGKGSGKAIEARKAPLPKECPQCSYLRPARMPLCPSCGFKPAPVSHIEHRDGNLTEITRGAKRAAPGGHINLRGVVIAHAEFFAQLKHHAEDRNYKPGWAANQFREATGSWPNHYRDVAPKRTSPEVSSWIKSRLIRFAKSRKVRAAQMDGQP